MHCKRSFHMTFVTINYMTQFNVITHARYPIRDMSYCCLKCRNVGGTGTLALEPTYILNEDPWTRWKKDFSIRSMTLNALWLRIWFQISTLMSEVFTCFFLLFLLENIWISGQYSFYKRWVSSFISRISLLCGWHTDLLVYRPWAGRCWLRASKNWNMYWRYQNMDESKFLDIKRL